MSWLTEYAEWNVFAMLETDAVFHLLMSALSVGLLANTEAILVTAAVFHSTILPYVVPSPPIHAVTAVAMLVSVMHVAQSELTVQVATLKLGHADWNAEVHRRRRKSGGASRKPGAIVNCVKAGAIVAAGRRYIAFLLQSDSALAPSQVAEKHATLSTFHLAMFWLKVFA
jgi:hypothetical protein